MEGEDGMDEIGQLLNDYTSLQAAHRSLLERCETQSAEIYAEVQGEMEILRTKVKDLQEELTKVVGEKEELSATVRDLRVNVEESRRAIMRLQGGGTNALGVTGAQSSSSNGISTGGAANQSNRRSMGPAALSSWNPKEVPSSGGVTSLLNSSATSDNLYSHHTPEEAAELKKSKRASLAFGPNAQGTIGRRAHGHRRIASGSRIGVDDEDGQSVTAPSQGLRELHLGGAAPTANGQTSRKSSFYGGSSNVRSPASDTSDLPLEEGTERSINSLLIPSKANRRASNSSSLSGSVREENETGLAVPVSVSRNSVSPSTSTMTSPIMEAEEGDINRRWSQGQRSDDYDEPWTARAIPNATHSSLTSTFSAMQQHNADNYSQLQRQLAEQKFRVQDRDSRLSEMQRDMNALRMELDEAKEARLASEACLKALRDFVKDEGGRSTDSDGGAQMLKGVKLPPLPTDKDTDDLSSDSAFVPTTPGRFIQVPDINTPTQASTASTWKAFGNTFASLSRTKSDDSAAKLNAAAPEVANSTGTSTTTTTTNNTNNNTNNINNNNNTLSSSIANTAPLSPSAQIGSSIGTLWSRATKRDSMSTGPSEFTTSNTHDSRHTSISSTTTQGDLSNQNNGAAPTPGFKGFAWFNKRTISDENANEATSPVVSTRVSSPPFANLDNHVLTLDQVQNNNNNSQLSPGLRKASVTSSNRDESNTAAISPVELNDRVRKAKEKSDAVDEDTGFVPPTF